MGAHPHPQISGTIDWVNYMLDVARGIVPGAGPFGGYGKRTTTGAESNILWPNGTFSIPPAIGVQLSLASTSAEDSAAGTGIRTLDIHYLDTDLNPQVETKTLNGPTPVLTTAADIRFVQCIHLLTVGSAKAAVGTISASAGGVVYAEISAGARRCTSSVRMVPRGSRLLVNALSGGSASGSAGAVTILDVATMNFDGHDFTEAGIFIPLASAALQDGSTSLVLPTPLPFNEGEVVGMQFTTDKAATIVGSWFGVLEAR